MDYFLFMQLGSLMSCSFLCVFPSLVRQWDDDPQGTVKHMNWWMCGVHTVSLTLGILVWHQTAKRNKNKKMLRTDLITKTADMWYVFEFVEAPFLGFDL